METHHRNQIHSIRHSSAEHFVASLAMSIQNTQGDETSPLLPVTSWPSQNTDDKVVGLSDGTIQPPDPEKQAKIQVVCDTLW